MIRIALPNKGRLAENARELLERAGLEFDMRERALQASLGPDFTALFVNARDIPEFVADGAADVGITGGDLVAEYGHALDTLLDLGFGRCRLAVAAREDSGIESIDDVPPDARVATVFPNLTRRYFQARSHRVTLVPISGAAEIAPHIGLADVIVDLVSTGSTLKVNGLREVATVLESSAVLIARPHVQRPHARPDTQQPEARQPDARQPGMQQPDMQQPDMLQPDAQQPDAASDAQRSQAPADVANNARIRELTAALESVIRAQGQRYLMTNVPRRALADIKRILPGINGPTIIDVLDGGEFVAAHAVVAQRDIYRTIAQLKDVGAQGILVTKIERLMP